MTLDSRTTTRSDLEGKRLPELQQMAQTMGVSGYQRLRKGDLIDALMSKSGEDGHGDGGAGGQSNGEVSRPEPEVSRSEPEVSRPEPQEAPAVAASDGGAPDEGSGAQTDNGNSRNGGDGSRREQGGGGVVLLQPYAQRVAAGEDRHQRGVSKQRVAVGLKVFEQPLAPVRARGV